VLFPVLLVETLAQADLRNVPVAAVGGALALGILIMLALCLSLRGSFARCLALDGPAFTSVVQGVTRWNTTLALAVVAELYGDAGLAIASVAAVTMIPLLNVANVWVLAHYAAPSRRSWGRVLLAIAQNPFIWSCIIGYALNVLRPPIPDGVYEVADVISLATLPLGLLLVGGGLRLADLLELRRVTMIATALKLVLMPALVAALSLAFGLSGATFAVVACCSAVPSASNSYVLARQMGGDAPLMAEILTMQTVIAIITMPVVIALST
jgi:predicted permease